MRVKLDTLWRCNYRPGCGRAASTLRDVRGRLEWTCTLCLTRAADQRRYRTAYAERYGVEPRELRDYWGAA